MPNHIPHAPYGVDPNYAQPAQQPQQQVSPPIASHQLSLANQLVLKLKPWIIRDSQKKISQALYFQEVLAHQEEEIAAQQQFGQPWGSGHAPPANGFSQFPPGHHGGPGASGFHPGYPPHPTYFPMAESAPAATMPRYSSAGVASHQAPHRTYAPRSSSGSFRQSMRKMSDLLNQFTLHVEERLKNIEKKNAYETPHSPGQAHRIWETGQSRAPRTGNVPPSTPHPPVPDFYRHAGSVAHVQENGDPRLHYAPRPQPSDVPVSRWQENDDNESHVTRWLSSLPATSEYDDVETRTDSSSNSGRRYQREHRRITPEPRPMPRKVQESGGAADPTSDAADKNANKALMQELRIIADNQDAENDIAQKARQEVLRSWRH